jgi:CHAD domain-containing protein
MEIFAPAFPRKQHRAVLKEVKTLADALGERRDRDVAIESMTKIGYALTATDRRGIDHLIEDLRDEQRGANAGLAAALKALEENDLRGRLRALAATA